MWFREGIQIPHSEDFQIVQDGNRSILFIREVLPEDSGVFTCRLTNAAGVAECSAVPNGVCSAALWLGHQASQPHTAHDPSHAQS